ncbi:MAG: YbaK/EbsC family protein [Clostridia bacterium]|nr:YbaK/EbsC family protein [Clostridia bacterium]
MSRIAAENALKETGFIDRLIVMEENTATVQLAAEALGVEPGRIAKTLSFIVRDQPVLIVFEGTARIDNAKFKQAFGVKAKMIAPDQVEALVGHAPGGVCPFGRKAGVPVYLDVSLKNFDPVYPAAGDDHTAVRLALSELEAAMQPVGWVDVAKEGA